MALPMPPFFKRKTDRVPRMGEPSSLPTISSQRLALCWIDHADVAGIYEIYSDNKMGRHAPFSHQDDAHIYIESIHQGFNDGKLFQWGICLQGSQKIIGTCTLNDISPDQGSAGVGYAIAGPYKGQGYGSEAMAALIGYAFGELGLRRLEADVDPHNVKCLKSLEALGFRREGYLRQRWLVAGELQDSVILGLLKSDCMPEAKQVPMSRN